MKEAYTAEQLNLIYEAVLNQVEEGVVISDDENKILFINRAAEVIEGIEGEKSINKSMEELYSPTELTRFPLVKNITLVDYSTLPINR